MKKCIKCIWAFLIAFIGMCLIGFFGLLGVCAMRSIFNYLFTHCNELIWYTAGFAISLIGVVCGWCVFCNGADKLKSG